ncbi:pyridoxamine 5'-phosphate oxidase family protein [Candidatus Nitrosocosmicus arcticus]|uniref:Putative pyridoxamine 5'-phosphate oxidase FMN-binding protein n=1 Tax=Candidatus Nitrosocosmicus arcticus TaxID=2035267 RepID=A0A557SZL3_9ARCH|nr:pyridoxamine 5'-phosphate oxidase family protein [Candidatus Nitrosocosmicus arcticus]TVP42049.1 putative pyridoxamine 5'-phosphate oxidase FMN-binding protein [Candidatus Nitrosocosmicus arcticus]
MFQLTPSEFKFTIENECCRLATSFKDRPHVVPVSYIYENNFFYISTDYHTKKLYNVNKNPNVSLAVDIYKPNQNKGIVVNGIVRLIENGQIYDKIYLLFYRKFEWVRNDPWKEGEAPFLEIKPYEKTSWGIN